MKGQIIDIQGRVVATVEVTRDGNLYTGRFEWADPGAGDLALWTAYEEAVVGQCFAEVDRLEELVLHRRYQADLVGYGACVICELQLYPSDRAVSFEIPVGS